MGLQLQLEADGDAAFGLWEEHLPAWEAWCAVSGQWRTETLSTAEEARVVWLGLDYTAARAGLDLAGIEMTPEVWDDVRAIEAGAIEEMNRRGR